MLRKGNGRMLSGFYKVPSKVHYRLLPNDKAQNWQMQV
jgi:hypothetical protein